MRATKIELSDGYRIESDSTCWTLVYDKVTGIDPKTGKPKRRYETWYYPNLEYGLRMYRDLLIRGVMSGEKMTDVTADQMLARIEESDRNIKAALEAASKIKMLEDPTDRVFDRTSSKGLKRKMQEEQSESTPIAQTA